jgi:outer membrane protein assembly factor BamB
VDWRSWGGEQWGSVTLLPDGTLLSPGRGRLTSLDSQGEVLWQYPALTAEGVRRNNNFPPPGDFFVVSGIAVDNNHTFYAGVDRSRMVAFGFDGTPKWQVQTNSPTLNRASPVVAADGTVYFASGDGTLYAVDPFGTTKWTVSVGGPLIATPVLAQDGAIFAVGGLQLWAISAEGHVLSRTDVGYGGEASPTLATDGTIYIATLDGRVIAFTGGHGGIMNSPWPKYQADLSNSGTPRPL